MAEEVTALSGGEAGQQAAVDAGVVPYQAASTAETIKETTDFQGDFIDKDTSTVQGQLSSLLATDSPYIKEAKRGALETAAGRGLQNTSISAGAGERAAIQSALPIAQQDAQTYSQSQLDTQRALQGVETAKAEGTIQGALQEQQYDFQGTQNTLNRAHEQSIQDKNLESKEMLQDMAQTHASFENSLSRAQELAVLEDQQGHEVAIRSLDNSYNVGMQEMQDTQQEMITRLNLAGRETENVLNASNQIMANYQASVVSLLSDPTFLELSGADLNKTLDNMKNMAKNQVNFVGSMSQVDLSQYLASAFPTLSY